MDEIKPYEKYPQCMTSVAVLLNVTIYALGAAILAGFGVVMSTLYLLYCLGNELHVMKKSCVDCFYYGRWCAFGKGKVAPLLFKQGEPGRFISKKISWKELMPDILVLMIPLLGGIALLVQRFSWSVALMLAALLVLSLNGTYVIRSQIACKYCKQRELGCPAEQFFSRR